MSRNVRALCVTVLYSNLRDPCPQGMRGWTNVRHPHPLPLPPPLPIRAYVAGGGESSRRGVDWAGQEPPECATIFVTAVKSLWPGYCKYTYCIKTKIGKLLQHLGTNIINAKGLRSVTALNHSVTRQLHPVSGPWPVTVEGGMSPVLPCTSILPVDTSRKY